MGCFSFVIRYEEWQSYGVEQWKDLKSRVEEIVEKKARERRDGAAKNNEEKQVNKMTRYTRTLQKWSKTKQRGNRPNAERNENVHSSCGLIKTATI
jgi:hypothetical protein